MDEVEFDALLDGYIERTAGAYGEMPAEHFLVLLVERAAGQTEETVHLSIAVDEDDDLTIRPDRELSDIVIRGNDVGFAKK